MYCATAVWTAATLNAPLLAGPDATADAELAVPVDGDPVVAAALDGAAELGAVELDFELEQPTASIATASAPAEIASVDRFTRTPCSHTSGE